MDEPAEPGLAEAFENLRTNPEMVAERERIAPYLDAPPDKTLVLTVEMDVDAPEGIVEYFCPMPPEVVIDEPGKCPKCAMKLMPRAPPWSTPARCTRRSSATTGEVPEVRDGADAGGAIACRRGRGGGGGRASWSR